MRSRKPTERLVSHGGVSIIYRSTYKPSKVSSLPQVKTLEYVCRRPNANRIGGYVVASIYCPGSAAVTSEFFTELTRFVEPLATYRCPMVLLGDFNIHTERSDDMHAIVSTHQGSDPQCWRLHRSYHNDCRVERLKVSEVGLSDHCIVTCCLPVKLPNHPNVTTSHRRMSPMEAF